MLGKVKVSNVLRWYNSSNDNKLVGKQEVIYMCVTTTGSTEMWYTKRSFILRKVCEKLIIQGESMLKVTCKSSG
jgi:hypothetical protein